MPDTTPQQDAAALCAAAVQQRTQGRTLEARRLNERALLVEPGCFQANISLALLDLDAGDLDSAERRVAQSRARHGPSPAAAWLGARVALARGEFDAALARLAPLLADGGLAPEPRADALLLAADALEALGRTGEAFAATAQGKGLQHALYARRAASREGEVEKLRRLADWFAAADPAPWRAAPGAGARTGGPDTHVFLVGFPRSGTTLLETVLAGSADVTTLEEAPTLADAYAEFMTGAEDLERLARLTADEADHWRGVYWRTVNQIRPGPIGRVFVDKAPAGALYLPLVAKLFPEAKILFALRDPRDVTLSCFRNNFQLNAVTYTFTDLARTAACYDACMGMAEVYRAVLPLAVHDVRHEALVADFDGALAEVADFLGVPMTAAMGDVAATAASRTIRTPSARQVRAGLNPAGLGRWRAYADQLAPVRPVLAPWVERFGYPAD